MWNRYKMSANLRALIFIGILNFTSCMDRNIYETSRPAVTRQYEDYLNNKSIRSKIDQEWINDTKLLVGDGFNRVAHPYGDNSLNEMGIKKIRIHKYSNF